jgi:hypothetical protein
MKKINLILIFAILLFSTIVSARVTVFQLDQMASHILRMNGIPMQGRIFVDATRASGYAATTGNPINGIIYVDPFKMQTLSANTWAFIIAHELAHIHLGHTGLFPSVQNEFTADSWGATWAVRAGYNADEFLAFMATEPNICTPSHGCWHDRIRNIMWTLHRKWNYYQQCPDNQPYNPWNRR